MTGRLLLRVAAGVELGTLALLLLNLATVHVPEVSRVLGPVHGLAYLGTIICAALIADGRHRPWLLALIPGAGGMLAVRAVSTAGGPLAAREFRPARPAEHLPGESESGGGGE